MKNNCMVRLIQVATITVSIMAVCQELGKPAPERKWHGKVMGAVPYDFQAPTLEKIRQSYWNADTNRIFTPEVFGVGWAVNFYEVARRLDLHSTHAVSEEDFLMPNLGFRCAYREPPLKQPDDTQPSNGTLHLTGHRDGTVVVPDGENLSDTVKRHYRIFVPPS